MDKVLMNLKEFCEYMGIGQTKAREIVNDKSNGFSIRVGAKIFVHKKLLDEHLEKCCKYQMEM